MSCLHLPFFIKMIPRCCMHLIHLFYTKPKIYLFHDVIGIFPLKYCHTKQGLHSIQLLTQLSPKCSLKNISSLRCFAKEGFQAQKSWGAFYITYTTLHLSQYISPHNDSEKFCNKYWYIVPNLHSFLTLTMTCWDHHDLLLEKSS